jgi:hypothetical protein
MMNINIRHIVTLSVHEFNPRKINYLYLYTHHPFISDPYDDMVGEVLRWHLRDGNDCTIEENKFG